MTRGFVGVSCKKADIITPAILYHINVIIYFVHLVYVKLNQLLDGMWSKFLAIELPRCEA